MGGAITRWPFGSFAAGPPDCGIVDSRPRRGVGGDGGRILRAVVDERGAIRFPVRIGGHDPRVRSEAVAAGADATAAECGSAARRPGGQAAAVVATTLAAHSAGGGLALEVLAAAAAAIDAVQPATATAARGAIEAEPPKEPALGVLRATDAGAGLAGAAAGLAGGVGDIAAGAVAEVRLT